MAAAWQASGAIAGSGTGADITVVIPAHQADDILILFAASRVITETCLTPSGWTLLYGPVDETAWRTYIFWMRATSGSETNPLLDWSATAGEKFGQIHTIRGAIKTGDPFAASAQTDGAADPGVCTGVTTTEANQLVIVAGIGADNLTSLAPTTTSTDPATYTSRHYSEVTIGADASGWFLDANRATAGATGNVSCDFNAAPLHWSILVAAILDEPPPAGVPNALMMMGAGF